MHVLIDRKKKKNDSLDILSYRTWNILMPLNKMFHLRSSSRIVSSLAALVWADMFFFIAHTMLCFEFVRKTVLITHWCFMFLLGRVYTVRDFSVFHTAPSANRLRGDQELRKTQLGGLAPTDQWDIPYHRKKEEERQNIPQKGGRREDIWRHCICLPKKLFCMMKPCVPGND